jgi:hypothetical protein
MCRNDMLNNKKIRGKFFIYQGALATVFVGVFFSQRKKRRVKGGGGGGLKNQLCFFICCLVQFCNVANAYFSPSSRQRSASPSRIPVFASMRR